MELKFICKDPNSMNGHCPAIYDAAMNGKSGLAIQGKYLGAEGDAQLIDRASDEGGVWISDELGQLIAEYYNSRA